MVHGGFGPNGMTCESVYRQVVCVGVAWRRSG